MPRSSSRPSAKKNNKHKGKAPEPDAVEEEVQEEQEVPETDVAAEEPATDQETEKDDHEAARDKTLANLYDVPETERDLAALNRARHRRLPWWGIVAIIAGVLLVTAATGFWFFTARGKKISTSSMTASFQVPANVASGAPVDIILTAKNTGRVELRDVEFTAQLPEGAALVSSTPAPQIDRPTTWSVSTIAPNADTQLAFHIRFSGAVDDVQQVRGTFTYRPSNTSATFSQNVQADVHLTASLLDLKLDGPLQVTPDHEVTYTATVSLVESASPAPKEIEVSADLPDGFTVSKATPEAVETNRRWRFRSITTAKPVKVSLTGKISGDAKDLRELRMNVGIVEADGTISSQDEASLIIVLVNSAVSVSLTSGDAAAPTVNVGSPLPLTLSITNSSELELADATVNLTVVGRVADLAQLSANPTGTKSKGTLTWTKQQVPALASLKPGDKVDVTITVPTLSSFIPARTDRNLTITANAAVTSPSLAAAGAATNTPQATIIAKVNSVLTLTSIGRYFSEAGTAVGSGPLPPEVGKTTTYRITWTVSNAYNDVADTQVSAILPPESFWTGTQSTTSTGNLVFDPLSRTATWTIGRLAAGSTGNGVVTASFEVAMTPTASQAGQLLALVDAATVRATDTFTTTVLKQTATAVTSDLSNDPLAQGKGIVVSGSVGQ